MQPSLNCLKLIKYFENCSLVAYADIFGVLTIGWGHTKDVFAGMTCTQEQADRWLYDEINLFGSQILKALNADEIEVNQNQFDALVSFAYNLGTYTLVHGSRNAAITKIGQIWQSLKYGNLEKAAEKFTLYTNKGVRGLVIRRTAESKLFLGTPIDEVLDWARSEQSKKN